MVTLVYHGGKCLIHCSCLVGSFYFSLIYLEWMVFFSRFFKQMSFLTKMRYEFEVFLVWICLVSNRVYSILVQTFEKIKICLSWMTSTFDTAFSKTGCCQSYNLFPKSCLGLSFFMLVGNSPWLSSATQRNWLFFEIQKDTFGNMVYYQLYSFNFS